MHTVVLSELQFPHLCYGDLISGLQGGGENCDIMHAVFSRVPGMQEVINKVTVVILWVALG